MPPIKTTLLDWLQRQPLLHHDTETGFTMVHAGLPPQWTILQAISFSNEVESVLRGDQAHSFFQHMYGDKPDLWSDDLADWKRLRFITNALTRIRYCHPDGRMDFTNKGPPNSKDSAFIPWYRMTNRCSHKDKILFGHWASLSEAVNEDFNHAKVYPLDKGCVWGRQLAALRLEDQQYFSVPSRQSV